MLQAPTKSLSPNASLIFIAKNKTYGESPVCSDLSAVQSFKTAKF